MARRRYSNRRRRGGGSGFLYKLLSVLVICGCLIAALTLFFRVDVIEISGEHRYTAREIQDASGIQVGDNLVTMWEPDINDRICQKLPYVERVVLHRVLPDRVNLLVVERTAAATVEGGGSQWLLSADGYLLETTQEP